MDFMATKKKKLFFQTTVSHNKVTQLHSFETANPTAEI